MPTATTSKPTGTSGIASPRPTGWLVFEPNYRGSTGYGDKFALQIVPEIVSRPGKDILTGVDALVKDGIADANQLAVGGYSYGGYMTNWLITQTTRFKAAVTGAGAVEHVANWGNDDTTVKDDAYFLGGLPLGSSPTAIAAKPPFSRSTKSERPRTWSREPTTSASPSSKTTCSTAPSIAEHPQQPADLPRRRPLSGQESLARKNQSPRRTEVAGKIRRPPPAAFGFDLAFDLGLAGSVSGQIDGIQTIEGSRSAKERFSKNDKTRGVSWETGIVHRHFRRSAGRKSAMVRTPGL
jgi:hypothetical protein